MDEFDRLLYESSAQLPPDLPGQEPPRPWERPMKRICWGLALVSVTLNFPGVDVILPAVGAVLLWQGLRSLRGENGGFRFACRWATVYAALRLTVTVLLATPLDRWLTDLIHMDWYTGTGPVPFHHVLRVIVIHSALVLAVGGLWQGLKTVFRDAGQRPRTAAAGGLVALEALMIPFALISLEGWLLVGPVLILWAVLVRNLWKLSRSLDEAGYALTPAPVRMPSGAAFGVWLGAAALALIVLPFAFNRLPVSDSTPVSDPEVRDEALIQDLLDLGFPEDLLARLELDLGPDGPSMLRGAYGLTVKGSDGLSVKGSDGLPDPGPNPDGIPGTVMFEIPVRDGHYGFRTVYLAYLRWSPEDLSGCGYMEGIKVVPDWQGVSVRTTAPEGKLVWEDGQGVRHEAALSFFRGSGSAATWLADFSLPRGVDGPVEGWVYWDLAPTRPEAVSLFNYQIAFAHRVTPWQYPYTLPSDVLAADSVSPGWRINGMRSYTGCMAPEGDYRSGMY